MTAAETLAGLLDEHAGAGRPVPCWCPSTLRCWTAEDAAERALAVVGCSRCPAAVLAACGTAAHELKASWGVWAGRDYSDRPNQTWRNKP